MHVKISTKNNSSEYAETPRQKVKRANLKGKGSLEQLSPENGQTRNLTPIFSKPVLKSKKYSLPENESKFINSSVEVRISQNSEQRKKTIKKVKHAEEALKPKIMQNTDQLAIKNKVNAMVQNQQIEFVGR